MIELKITMDNNGSIQVYGPLENKILCFGLLTFAEDIIMKYNAQTKVTKPSPADVVNINKKKTH